MVQTIGTSEELIELAEVIHAFARQTVTQDGAVRDREQLAEKEKLPKSWTTVSQQGFHSLHIAEKHGGQGAEFEAFAVATEQMSEYLYTGPFLATGVCAAILQELVTKNPEAKAFSEALQRISEGATAACVIDEGLTAVGTFEGILLDGKVAPVLGGAQAEILLARVNVEERRTAWVLLPTHRSECTVQEHESIDLTQSLASVHVQELTLDADQIVYGLSAPRARRLFVTALAADACGIANATAERAVQHAKVRHQFRRPIASFQALQHRLAAMFVQAEQARAMTWEATRIHPDDDAQQDEIVTHQLVITALQYAVDNALEYVMTLGAMGFTWEHDAHLYWRRALQNLALAGPKAVSERALGRLAQQASRPTTIADEADLPELRSEVAEILSVAGDPTEGIIYRSAWTPRKHSKWQQKLAEHGLVSPQLPKPYGRGADPLAQAVILEEFKQQGQVPPALVIGDWVVPTLIEHGTSQQQERFVPATLRGDILWCQLFSEPGAGSDLTSLTTKAVKVAGGWRVTGQKIWNSLADVADWGALLVRTDQDGVGRHGLSYFLLNMHAEGVDIRPIRQATGLTEFCEVFLDDVFVPDEDVVGTAGEGWKLATTTLTNERLRMGEELGHGGSQRFLALMARTAEPELIESALPALGRATARENNLAALAARGAIKRMQGLEAHSETSVLKLANILAQRQGSADLVALQGPAAALEDVAVPGAEHGDLLDHVGLPAVLLGGGTPDIQLTVIARNILGISS